MKYLVIVDLASDVVLDTTDGAISWTKDSIAENTSSMVLRKLGSKHVIVGVKSLPISTNVASTAVAEGGELLWDDLNLGVALKTSKIPLFASAIGGFAVGFLANSNDKESS
jgi:hypothetical protein